MKNVAGEPLLRSSYIFRVETKKCFASITLIGKSTRSRFSLFGSSCNKLLNRSAFPFRFLAKSWLYHHFIVLVAKLVNGEVCEGFKNRFNVKLIKESVQLPPHDDTCLSLEQRLVYDRSQ